MPTLEKDRDEWEQVDRNAGRRGGWLYAVIANKARPAWVTGWLERYFDDDECAAGFAD
jgi:hypothetical protein